MSKKLFLWNLPFPHLGDVKFFLVLNQLEHNGEIPTAPKVNYDKKKEDICIATDKQDNIPATHFKSGIMNTICPEVIAFMFQFAVGISNAVITNTWLKSYCLLEPNMTDFICSGAIPTEIENKIQPEVSRMILIKTCIETLLPGLAILFVGPWSDIHGRRPLLLLTFSGFTLSYSLWAFLSTKTRLNPLYFLCASIPIGLTGGVLTYFLSLVCSISDITPVNKRSFKMAVFQACLMAGGLTSQLLTAKVSSGPYGFTTAYSISAVTCIIVLTYTYFFFPETVSHRASLVDNGFIFDVFKTSFKKRPNHTRTLIFLVIILNILFDITCLGEASVFYLSCQKRFGWQLKEFSQLTSFTIVLSGITLYFGTWFISSFLRVKDLTAMLLVSVTRIVCSILYTFAKDWKLLYVGVCVGSLATLITPLYRSQISKFVPLHELGKVMSFAMFIEAFAPISATFMYTTVYNMTIEKYPTTVFLVSTGLSIICTSCILLAYIIHCFYPIQDFSQLDNKITETGPTADNK
ncbi:putative peptidoglycan muropeptide transporter SLC46 isoform X3 [Lycorma delicatula]|uniref:putative peptidoglycan muropeptide transporter SLC46 isoform X3 n=1 Tax=Lycorma delicatula TaxID=130591 RepID=UPI003F513EAE